MSRPGRTGSSRTIGAAYTGATGFRQSGGLSQLRPRGPPGNGRDLPEYINVCGVFPCENGSRPLAHMRDWWNRTLAIRNLTVPRADRIFEILKASKANIVSVTEEQPVTGTPRPKPPRRLGLSGKLLLLTIPLVMIAGMMIYVPAIANFRMNRLNDRLAAANTAALVLDAAPSGMVPDSLARQILDSIGAHAVAIKMGQQRRLLASADLPASIDHDVDMRTMTAWSAIVDSFETMLESGDQTIRVIGPAPGGAQFIETVVDEAPLRRLMYRFSRNLLLVSL